MSPAQWYGFLFMLIFAPVIYLLYRMLARIKDDYIKRNRKDYSLDEFNKVWNSFVCEEERTDLSKREDNDTEAD